ncbi:DUF1513 domain-containing protein [Marinomonas sp. M1K-6]|uniref:DUF1513 domain-containing protein n=1 Tax=Marinomonas profundi TaxID=2726122 RepID=A0A847R4H8_9GAMM|nr:DUF1513 domain-containing protein [Marinomonas profundi]NLQ18892.1 DUF1513 domain-containing protein [Marinomonas profundi]UDV02827.1 DUF1513 domain-containing protein [Marinomonas profundi]
MLSRRSFLTLSGALITAPSWGALSQQKTGQILYASAYSLSKQAHFFALFDDQGDIIWTAPLTNRAHAPVVHPNQSIVGIVSRRPGFFMDFFDVSSNQKIKRIKPSKDHHFYGHALFTEDGKRLITQESHYPTGAGKIFIRDWPTGNIVQSFSSNGIGPHESVFLNEQVLVIANGGMMTHPDEDRNVLNLDTMQPNVTYLSLKDGQVLNQVSHNNALHQLSIRHLDVNPQGIVALGFQYQGDIWDQVPLVALSRVDQPTLEYLPIPEDIRVRFKQYCGSVCFDKTGDVLAISTPRGGLVAYWHAHSKTFLGVENCRDVCGLVATDRPYEFLLTSGTGVQLKSNPIKNHTKVVKKHARIQWDNHLRQINL